MKISLKNILRNAALAAASVAGGLLLGNVLSGGAYGLATGFASGVTAALATTGLAITVTLPMLGIGALVIGAAGLGARFLTRKMINDKYTKYIKTYYPGKNLTAGEKNFARAIFGKDLSAKFLNATTKHFLPDPNPDMAAAVYGGKNRIQFYGPQYQEADYSRTPNIENSSIFIHEMTHLWQNKHRLRSHKLFHHYRQVYNYQLTPHSRFTKFGDEQQAAIVGDYALRFIFNDYSRWINNTPETDALLKKVVEKKFPAARETRLRLEAQRTPSHP